MAELNLLAGIENSEEHFFDAHIANVFDKCKAARRLLILLLMIRDPLRENESQGEPFDKIEQAYIELAAAVFANGRAAFLLVLKGYLFPAQILLRSLWEQIVFMEYFRLYPDEGEAWASATGEDRSARTPNPEKAWGAIKSKGQFSVLGGKRGAVYHRLSQYAHSHRNALFDLTTMLSDTTAATSFGPAYQPLREHLEFIYQLMVSLLVSAISILEKVFEKRLRQQNMKSLEGLLIEILELAGIVNSS